MNFRSSGAPLQTSSTSRDLLHSIRRAAVTPGISVDIDDENSKELPSSKSTNVIPLRNGFSWPEPKITIQMYFAVIYLSSGVKEGMFRLMVVNEEKDCS